MNIYQYVYMRINVFKKISKFQIDYHIYYHVDFFKFKAKISFHQNNILIENKTNLKFFEYFVFLTIITYIFELYITLVSLASNWVENVKMLIFHANIYSKNFN